MNTTAEARDLAATLGLNLRAARKAMGMTQEKTAERVGISTDFYGRLERGCSLPSILTLWQLAAVLRTATDTLLGLPSDPTLET